MTEKKLRRRSVQIRRPREQSVEDIDTEQIVDELIRRRTVADPAGGEMELAAPPPPPLTKT